MADAHDEAGLRLDKWLWYARFFKTRSLASKAISNGRFRLDGDLMSKPHRQAKSGQVLTFSQGTSIRVVRIKALGARRGPANEAALLYDDLAPVTPATENYKPARVPVFEERQVGGGRPTKRQRRETDRLKAGLLDSED
ncbi:RNA-binding S4 domain-containing protein [Alphaproteobacteria bacterium]|nr:RNA-binding S4 domain-containing protein [Alphaproteobacteria bacterium]MDC1120529.1 RNA-binding S4 domain-containing protein [Alphaproteobacteria bacterium]